jgi:hypothetical protein
MQVGHIVSTINNLQNQAVVRQDKQLSTFVISFNNQFQSAAVMG